LTFCRAAPSLGGLEEAGMTYDWDGRRNRLAKAARITTGAALALFALGLPLLIFA